MHPAAFEPRLDHELVGALDTATADRIARANEGLVADLLQPAAEIGVRRLGDHTRRITARRCQRRQSVDEHLLLPMS